MTRLIPPREIEFRLPPAANDGARSAAKLREAVLRRELAHLLQERDALQHDLAVLHSAASDLRSETERLRQDLANREQIIAALYASHSWQAMAPARRIASALRRQLGRAQGAPSAASGGPAADPGPGPAPAVPVTHPAAHERPAPAAGRGEILVVADILPLFDQASGGLRLKTLIDMMGDAGWSIVYGSCAGRDHQPGVLQTPEGRARYEDALHNAGVSRFLYGIEEIDGFLIAEGRHLAHAFLSFPDVATALLPLVRSRCPTTRIAYDMVDFHGLRMAREAELRGDPDLREAAERKRVEEVACAAAADVTIAVTPEEKAALLEMVPEAVVEVLPNVFELPQKLPPGPEARNGLFFVGGFWHTPNGDAVCWFVERILPLLRAEIPDLVLRIAGANAGNDVLALGAQPGVEVLGFVPDLLPLFHQHRVFVAPLRYGAGMKGKVGQSMAHGLPVVATPVGAEGMGLQDGVHLLVAADEETFAAQVLRLLRDDALWSRLSVAGREHIERTLSVEAVRGRLEAVLGG